MIAIDEQALICDLAETYHIYDYKSLPVSKVATFSVGLRDDSRIKMKMNGMKYPINTILTAALVDRMSVILWAKTEDGRRNINYPKSVLAQLLGEDSSKETVGFSTPEEFEEARKKIIERSGK